MSVPSAVAQRDESDALPFSTPILRVFVIAYGIGRVVATIWMIAALADVESQRVRWAPGGAAILLTLISGLAFAALWLTSVRIGANGLTSRNRLKVLCVTDQAFFTSMTCAFGTHHTFAALVWSVAPSVLGTVGVGAEFGCVLALSNAVAISAFAMLRVLAIPSLPYISPEWPLYVASAFLYSIPAYMFRELLHRADELQQRLAVRVRTHRDEMAQALRDEVESNQTHKDLHDTENAFYVVASLIKGAGGSRNGDAPLALRARHLGDFLRAGLARIVRERELGAS